MFSDSESETQQLNINNADDPPSSRLDNEDESLEEHLGLRSSLGDDPVNLAASSSSSGPTHGPPRPYSDSKFAEVLGFGFFREPASPVNMGSLEIEAESDRPPDEQIRHPRPSTTAPMEPSFYQIGMRMADTQWAMNYQLSGFQMFSQFNNMIGYAIY